MQAGERLEWGRVGDLGEASERRGRQDTLLPSVYVDRDDLIFEFPAFDVVRVEPRFVEGVLAVDLYSPGESLGTRAIARARRIEQVQVRAEYDAALNLARLILEGGRRLKAIEVPGPSWFFAERFMTAFGGAPPGTPDVDPPGRFPRIPRSPAPPKQKTRKPIRPWRQKVSAQLGIPPWLDRQIAPEFVDLVRDLQEGLR